MLNIRALICLLAICTLCACGGHSGDSSDANTSTVIQSFPQPLFDRLLAECDYVDIIFYDSPASISQDDQGSIRSALMFMDPTAVQPKSDCKAIGRIAYMIQGEIVAEGDIYATPGCEYIAFLEDGKIIYSNKLSQNGAQFFSGILQQIEQARQ